MPRRNRFRIGDWLVEDEESGKVYYRSQIKERWDGALVSRKSWETRQPQEFVEALSDPQALTDIRPAETVAVAANVEPIFIGATNIPTPTGPASHLFRPGIGEMAIGLTFRVY